MMDIADIVTTGGVPLLIAIAGWIKASQAQHNKKLDNMLDKINDLRERVAVVEDRTARTPSFLPPGKTKNELVG